MWLRRHKRMLIVELQASSCTFQEHQIAAFGGRAESRPLNSKNPLITTHASTPPFDQAQDTTRQPSQSFLERSVEYLPPLRPSTKLSIPLGNRLNLFLKDQ